MSISLIKSSSAFTPTTLLHMCTLQSMITIVEGIKRFYGGFYSHKDMSCFFPSVDKCTKEIYGLYDALHCKAFLIIAGIVHRTVSRHEAYTKF